MGLALRGIVEMNEIDLFPDELRKRLQFSRAGSS